MNKKEEKTDYKIKDVFNSNISPNADIKSVLKKEFLSYFLNLKLIKHN